MNTMTQAYRTTCIPMENRLDTLIPSEYIGQELEVIVFPLVKPEIDLSPIELDRIDCNGKKLRFKERLVLVPELDESEQLYTVNYPDFNLETFAYTRQEITEGVKSDIAFLWEEYAKAEDSTLTKDALELKIKLLSSIEEIPNA